DDLGALLVVERLGDRAQRDRDAWRERDFGGSLRGVDDATVAAAEILQRLPPHVIPGGGAAALPDIEEFRYLAARALAQCSQRARVQVHAVPEDWKLATVFGESKRARLYAACERHRPGIYRRNAAYRELVRTVSAFGVEGAVAAATRRRLVAPRVEFSRSRLVSAPALPTHPAPPLHAVADVP